MVNLCTLNLIRTDENNDASLMIVSATRVCRGSLQVRAYNANQIFCQFFGRFCPAIRMRDVQPERLCIIGRPTLERFISRQTLDKVDKALNSAKGKSAMFLLFLLPGAPKDAMCYGAGLSKMGLTEFVVITGLARSPALFASILIGAHAGRGDYRSMVLIGLIVVSVIAGYYFYERYRNRGKQKL
jgi:general stress protein CsbA